MPHNGILAPKARLSCTQPDVQGSMTLCTLAGPRAPAMPNLWNHIPPPSLGPVSCPAPQLPEASVSRTLIFVSLAWWAQHAFRGPPPASLRDHGGNCLSGSCGSFPELPSLGTAVSHGWLSSSCPGLPQTYCPGMWPSLAGRVSLVPGTSTELEAEFSSGFF